MRIAIFFASLLAFACDLDRGMPSIRGALTESESAQVRQLPGSIAVSIRWGKDLKDDVSLALENGSIKAAPSPASPPQESSWRVFGGASMIAPTPRGARYAGPYAFSRNRDRAVAAYVADNQTEPATRVAVIDLSHGSIVGDLAGPKDAFVHGVTWSPDERFFATLFLRPERGSGGNPLAGISGHPGVRAAYVVVVATADGRKLAELEVASKAPASVGEIVWR